MSDSEPPAVLFYCTFCGTVIPAEQTYEHEGAPGLRVHDAGRLNGAVVHHSLREFVARERV